MLAKKLKINLFSYISFLQGTYFINLVSPFTRNVDREVSGTKKVYICDNGIISQFSRVDEGSLFENAVFHNIKRYEEVRYYQRRSGGEIDFILMNKLIGLEVKQTGIVRDYVKLKNLASSLKLQNYYVITRNFSDKNGFILSTDL